MEAWIIWAIVGAIVSGLYNFGFKIITEKKYSTYYSSLWSYSVSSIVCFCFLSLDGFSGFVNIDVPFLLFLAFGNILFFYISVVTRVKSMENIDNVIFYPLYKTFGPILVTLISLFYFKESLVLKEVIGIILGICIPLMLISKTESKRQKNLILGLSFMLLTAIASAISPIFVKLSNTGGFDIMTYIFLVFLMGVCFSFIGYMNEKRKKKLSNKEGIMKFGLTIGVFHFLSFYAFTKSFDGNMAIAFTINSFAILIPIVLSIIFYGEHFNLKKGIVIALSIVSILLFI